MMNRTMHLNHSAAMSVHSVRAQAIFAFDAARFFGALRFYFYYFFAFLYPSERKPVS